jgi:LPPG:FO 2-phospho-L-lactate transferase
METLRALGEDVWFNLGDRDLATHLLRTGWLREGASLSEVTARLARANGVSARVVPMSDAEVATEVGTADGEWLHFQRFLVERQAAVDVAEVRWRGIDEAAAAEDALAALADASLVVIGPSSPVASVLPVLGVRGMREAIERSGAPVVAVAPVVSGVPITDPGEGRRAECRARLLRAAGVGHTAAAVAELYRGLVGRFVLDTADAAEASAVAALGMDVVTAPTLVHLDPAAGPALAAAVLADDILTLAS